LARRSSKGRSPSSDVKSPAQGASDAIAGWTTLVTGLVVSGFLLWRNHSQWMDFSEYNLLNTACILWIPLMVVLIGLRREPSEFGLTPGDTGNGLLAALVLFLIFLPVILFFAPTPGPQEYYLNWMGPNGGSRAVTGIYFDGTAWSHGGQIDPARLAYHELAMGFYMFGWEWYHRGFLLNGLKKLAPVWAAVLIQAALFTALHWGKPAAELASSFPGGILMAVLALRYRSFVPCFVLHWLVSAGFDFAVLYYHFHR
jgi:membrane protease YdiL (CAAX protease family)